MTNYMGHIKKQTINDSQKTNTNNIFKKTPYVHKIIIKLDSILTQNITNNNKYNNSIPIDPYNATDILLTQWIPPIRKVLPDIKYTDITNVAINSLSNEITMT